jgi:hypothetical protein
MELVHIWRDVFGILTDDIYLEQKEYLHSHWDHRTSCTLGLETYVFYQYGCAIEGC